MGRHGQHGVLGRSIGGFDGSLPDAAFAVRRVCEQKGTSGAGLSSAGRVTQLSAMDNGRVPDPRHRSRGVGVSGSGDCFASDASRLVFGPLVTANDPKQPLGDVQLLLR